MKYGLLLASLLMLTAATIASSNMICIKIEAELAEVGDPYGLLEGAIQPGMVVDGLYIYESTTLDSNNLPDVGHYWHYRDPYGVRLSAGPFTFQTDPDNVEFLMGVSNDVGSPPRDYYGFQSTNNLPLPDGVLVDEIEWRLDAVESDVLESDKLPDTPPHLPDWESLAGLTIRGSDPNDPGRQFFVRGHVFSATLEQCEPYPVCIDILAEVEYVWDEHGMLEGRILEHHLVHGIYQYDGATPDSIETEDYGYYWHYAAPYGIAIDAGGWLFETDPGNTRFLVGTENDSDSGRDSYWLNSHHNLPLANGEPVDRITWQLDDTTMSALATDGLPLDPPVLADWTSFFGLTMTGRDPDHYERMYTVRAQVIGVGLCETAGQEDSFPGRLRADRIAVTARPNPFRSSVEILYSLANPGPLRIEIFDPAGRRVRVLKDGWRAAGSAQVLWDGRNEKGKQVESGVYFTRITQGDRQGGGRLIYLPE